MMVVGMIVVMVMIMMMMMLLPQAGENLRAIPQKVSLLPLHFSAHLHSFIGDPDYRSFYWAAAESFRTNQGYPPGALPLFATYSSRNVTYRFSPLEESPP